MINEKRFLQVLTAMWLMGIALFAYLADLAPIILCVGSAVYTFVCTAIAFAVMSDDV